MDDADKAAELMEGLTAERIAAIRRAVNSPRASHCACGQPIPPQRQSTRCVDCQEELEREARQRRRLGGAHG